MRATLALGFAMMLALAACGGDQEDHACTLIACFNGLLVTVANPPAEPYRVEASATGQPTQVRNCSAGQCFVLFNSFFPDTVTLAIIVTSSGASVNSATVSPMYRTAEPNGPGCGACRNATIAL